MGTGMYTCTYMDFLAFNALDMRLLAETHNIPDW